MCEKYLLQDLKNAFLEYSLQGLLNGILRLETFSPGRSPTTKQNAVKWTKHMHLLDPNWS